MTVWEKFCGQVSNRVAFLLEKNRIAAVKNRLKLALARETSLLDRVYMQIGRACFEEKRMIEDPQMQAQYQQIDQLLKKIDRLREMLEAAEQMRENNVIAVDFGGEPEDSPAEPAQAEEPETQPEEAPCQAEDPEDPCPPDRQ